MSAVIEVDDVWKKYRLGVIGTGTIRHDFERWWHRIRGKPDPHTTVEENRSSEIGSQRSDNGVPHANGDGVEELGDDEVWALRGVSFEVKQGEILGIIGRNGAGKSTLLKILSRVTSPTKGEVRVKGRIASLLEVGTGFHPERTGRENIFLNGAILGMTRTETKKKFDEIVAFADIETYIDTPVKRYSSGMYVRLAFAVAAHLESQILIVDEVLAVGDAQFQKKCLGKMGEVATGGRTVLFVSHNMAAVKSLCNWAMLLGEGKMRRMGDVGAVVSAYLQVGRDGASEREWKDPATAPGNEYVRLEHVRVRPPDGESVLTIDTGAVVEVGFFNARDKINLAVTVYVVNNEGILLFTTGHLLSCNEDSRVGIYRLVGIIPPHLLNAGRYSLNVVFGKDQAYVLFRFDDAVAFDIENTTTGIGANFAVFPGVIRPQLHWQHEFSPPSRSRTDQGT
jgi:lipopolysaccharide transport system ATP-binding protein